MFGSRLVSTMPCTKPMTTICRRLGFWHPARLTANLGGGGDVVGEGEGNEGASADDEDEDDDGPVLEHIKARLAHAPALDHHNDGNNEENDREQVDNTIAELGANDINSPELELPAAHNALGNGQEDVMHDIDVMDLTGSPYDLPSPPSTHFTPLPPQPPAQLARRPPTPRPPLSKTPPPRAHIPPTTPTAPSLLTYKSHPHQLPNSPLINPFLVQHSTNGYVQPCYPPINGKRVRDDQESDEERAPKRRVDWGGEEEE